MCCVEDERGKQVHCEGINLGDGVVIEETVEEGYKYLEILEEGYKYLGIIERGDICQGKMKENVQKEFYKGDRAVIKFKLNGGNVINGINIWAVGKIWYGTGMINWNKGDLDKVHQQTWKLLNMHRGLHPTLLC